MDFNLAIWKNKLNENLAGWKGRFQRAGINTFYYGLAATSLLPVIQAYHSGEMIPALVALGGVSAGLGANLLANKIQGWKDKPEREIAAELQITPELKETLDDLLEKMDTLSSAQSNLDSDAERRWFEELIRRELASSGSRITYQATLIGDGAIAQGPGAKAVGAGGILVGGNVNGNVISGNKNRVVQADTYVEKQFIESSKIDPEVEKGRKALEKYLNRLSRVCLSLPLAALGGGDGDESDITLDKVYIELNTTQKHEHSEESGLQVDDPLGFRRDEVQPITALESVAEHKRLALLGDPGAGKSTFVKNLLAWQAGAHLRKLSFPPGIETNLIPALIILRDLAPRLARLDVDTLPAHQRDEKLAQTVWEQIQNDLGEECADFCDGLREALQSGHCLLVLDGLDEVPHDLRVRVRQAVDALFKKYNLQRGIITCRVRSYVGDSVLPNFTSRTLAAFNEEQIGNFIGHWYTTQRELGKFNEEQARVRMYDLSLAALEDDMRELSSNPMLLTTMAIIHQREVGLPRERVRLYHLAVEVLLRRWQKHKAGDAALAEFLKNDLKLRAVMEALAYQAHRASTEKSGTGTLLRKDALDLLEQDEHLGDVKLAADFLDYVDQRAGLLVGYGGELTKPTSYRFPHRTFQEYLAGSYLAGKRERVRTFYEHAAEGDSWDLAAQLAFEELYYNRRSENELLDLAYQLDILNAHGSQNERSRLWAGQIIALVGREIAERDTHPNGGKNYITRLLPGLVDILGSNALPALERVEAGRTLAKLGDPRAEAMSVEAIQFCHVPGGKFLMGEEKEQHSLELPDFWMSKHPVTNAQFNQFMEAGGYADARFWDEAQKEKFWNAEKIKGRYDHKFRTAPNKYSELYNYSNHPVVGISWYEALAFTRWLDQQARKFSQDRFKKDEVGSSEKLLWQGLAENKLHITLPSEAEWEKAARGTDGRTYPWGAEADPDRANYVDSGIDTTSAIGCFSLGASPYGVLDMSGNVWEWIRSLYGKYPYPMKGKEKFERENLSATRNRPRVIRGGSFCDEARRVCCAYRDSPDLDYHNINIGFRVVVSPRLLS